MTGKERYKGEKLLIASLSDGDRSAYRHVIETYQENVIRVCRGFVHSNEDAEDLAQDVFIQLFRSVSTLRGEASLSTWLYRVAINKSINFLRSVKSRKDYYHGEIDDGTDTSSNECADNGLTAADHRKALRQALDTLPENQRTAFILQKYEDLSYEEISLVMKLSVSSVQSLIFRAKQNLQTRLKEYFEKNFT